MIDWSKPEGDRNIPILLGKEYYDCEYCSDAETFKADCIVYVSDDQLGKLGYLSGYTVIQLVPKQEIGPILEKCFAEWDTAAAKRAEREAKKLEAAVKRRLKQAEKAKETGQCPA